MNTKKIIKYILIAIPLLFLAKWGIETVMYDSNKIPDVNPHPTQKVRVHGEFPLEKDINMKIAVIYINKNPKCDRKVLLAGTQFPQKQEVTFPITIKDGKFESIVNLDDYLPGVCDWRAHRLYAFVESKNIQLNTIGDVSSGIYIASIENNNVLNDNTTTILCSYKKQTFYKGYSNEITKTILKCGSEDYLDYNISHLQKDINVDFVHKQ